MTARVWIMAGVALVLGGLVARDYWPSPPQAPAAEPTAVVQPAAQTLNPMANRQPADFAALFAQPLFAPTRKPPMAQTAAPPDTPPDTPPPADLAIEAPAQAPQPMLMGTVTSPWPGGAFLGDDQGGPVVFLRPGQQSQGLFLEQVNRTSALFKGPDGEVTLTLQPATPRLPLADPAPGDPAPGDPAPGDPAPGDTTPGDTTPGDTAPSDTAPSDTGPTMPAP